MDFSNCRNDDFHTYSGRNEKTQIIYNDKSYMVKYREKDHGKDVYCDFSEDIACKIFKSLGFETQNTILGELNGRDCVACENFLKDNEVLQEFSNFTNSSAYATDKRYTFETIINTIENHPNIFNKEEVKEKFWKMYVVDSFLGNFDRHGGNWGFVVNAKEKYSKFAPIYDCGSCLYPQMSDKEMDKVLNNRNEIEKRIYEFPLPQIMRTDDNNKKTSYAETINSLNYEGCNKAVEWFVKNVDFEKIDEIINNTEKISNKRKKFYSTMLKERFNYIIKPAYEKMLEQNKDKSEIENKEEIISNNRKEMLAYREQMSVFEQKLNLADKEFEKKIPNLKNKE